MHTFVRLTPILARLTEVFFNFHPFHRGNLKTIALVTLATNYSRIAYPRIVTNLTGAVGSEVAEVRSNRRPALPLRRFVIDIERAVWIGEHYRLQTLFGGHEWIVLWSPIDEVATIGGGKERSTVVNLEYQAPSAILRTTNRGMVHLLLNAPRTIVRGTKPSRFPPDTPLLHSNMQTIAGGWRINEYGHLFLCR